MPLLGRQLFSALFAIVINNNNDINIDINIIINNDDDDDNNDDGNEIALIADVITEVKGSNLPPCIKTYIKKKLRPNIYINLYYE